MKITISALIFAFLVLGTRGARAQEGNPFDYIVTSGSYLTGEPNGTYTSSGTPPTANVTVGALFVFHVYNSDSVNSRTARTMYSVVCELGTGGSGGFSNVLYSNAPYGPFSYVITPLGVSPNYTGTNQAEGNVPQWIGNSYVANAYITMQDEKTGDFSADPLTSINVNVN